MNDMLCWIQHIPGTGEHDREDPVVYAHWGVLLWREPQPRQIYSWTFSVCINESCAVKSAGGACF